MINQQRYKGNTMLDEVGIEGQQKLLDSKVLVIGSGGLGSGVIANLAALGVGTIGLVDFDVVEESNLNRQFIHKFENIGVSKVESAKKWIEEFNPDITVETYNFLLFEDNAAEVIEKYDCIVDGVDNFKTKFLINKICVGLNKKLVHGGVEEFSGQVFSVIGQQTACLGCLFSDFDHNTPKGILSSVVSTIGSLQSLEVAKLLLDMPNPLTNCVLRYDFLNARFQKIEVEKNKDCLICSPKHD